MSTQTGGQLNSYWQNFWTDRGGWEDMIATVGRPAMSAFHDNASTQLQMTKLDVNVEVSGVFSKTTFTMNFFNETNQRLSGELTFPLPEDSVVSGYGLDINGVIVDGVCVEKEKARITFEKEVRKGVDPGLIEKVQGNNFKTRVYPIEPNSSRQVKVEFTNDLLVSSGKEVRDGIYTLPIEIPDTVKEFSLEVKSNNSKKPFANPTTGLEFSESNGTYTASIKKLESIKGGYTIVFPEIYTNSIVVEQDESGEEFYFSICDFVKSQQDSKDAKKVKKVGILWDASFSRQEVDKSQEFKVVEAVLKSLVSKNSFDVQILEIRNKLDESLKLTINDEKDIAKVLSYLKDEVVYDGGTNLGSIPTKSKDNDVDFYLLFTDGLGNFGKDIPDNQYASPIYAFGSGMKTNHKLLSYLCEKSGGVYNNLNRISVEKSVELIGKDVFGFLYSEFKDEELSDVYPSKFTSLISNDGRVLIYGKLLEKEATLLCHFGVGSKIHETRKYHLKRSDAVKSNLIGFRWAECKISDLEIFAIQNKDEILSLGKKFSIVTSGTSLIVLETLQQHLEHKICPAKSRKQMYDDYMKTINNQKDVESNQVREKMKTIENYYNDMKNWWSTEHKQMEVVRKTESYKESMSEEKKMDFDQDFTAFKPSSSNIKKSFAHSPTNMKESSDFFEGDSLNLSEETPKFEKKEKSMKKSKENKSKSIDLHEEEELSMEPKSSEMQVKKRNDSKSDGNGSQIQLKPWDPNTPYLSLMKSEKSIENSYKVYLKERANYSTSPSFFLDCAEYFFTKNSKDLGIRIISSIVELELENVQLFRALAYKLESEGLNELAAFCYEKILSLRPEYPQPYRDLGLVLYKLGKYERAVQLLHKVLIGKWDDRFSGMEVVAHQELNAIIAKIKELEKNDPNRKKINIPLAQELTQNLDVDLRVVFSWDSDDTCIDLWVIEPDNSKCYYGTKRTPLGGFLTRDIMQGLGPNAWFTRKMSKGEYKISANYYSNYQQSLTGATIVFTKIWKNFGRENEECQMAISRITTQGETVELGVIQNN